eukprot:Platyproteum_vivax@DN7597_c0_g1_i11.p1
MLNAYFQPDKVEFRRRVNLFAVIFVILAVSILVIFIGQIGLFVYVLEKMNRRIRSALFRKLVHMEVGFHDHKNHSPGQLQSLLSADVADLKGLTGDILAVGLQNVSAVIAGIIIAMVASWELTLVVAAAMAVVGPAMILEIQFFAGSSSAVAEAVSKTAGLVTETVNSMRTVASLGNENRVYKTYAASQNSVTSVGIKAGIIAGLSYGLSQSVPFFSMALCFWHGGNMIEAKKLNFNQMMRVFFALTMAAQSIAFSSANVTDNGKAKSAAGRVFRIIDRESKINASSEEGRKEGINGGEIQLTNVGFFYPNRRDVQVFKAVDFTIESGTTVALVGATGCGKSTVVQLVERFYDIEACVLLDTADEKKQVFQMGDITIDGVKLSDYNLKYLRSQIGLVSQEPVLFDQSIMENIRWGKPEATDEEVHTAAKMANAYDFVSAFPDGFNTGVGPKGSRLSGGQKQRIAIARAILRDPKILLLDEATSALDNESEKIVQQALDTLLAQKKRTTLVIAHRLTTIRNANKIMVFANPRLLGSKIVEMGSHKELMNIENGVYKQLVLAAGAAGDE